MRTARSALVAALAAAATLLVMADAMAQFGGIPGGGMGGRRGARMGAGMEKGGPSGAARGPQESVTNLIDYRLALLQEDLNLARGQESGWLAYEERVKALAADITRERARAQNAAVSSAVDQVNHATDTARNRLAAWEDIASATKALYDILSPQQKLLADQRFPSIVHELSGISVPTDPGPKRMASPGPQ